MKNFASFRHLINSSPMFIVFMNWDSSASNCDIIVEWYNLIE